MPATWPEYTLTGETVKAPSPKDFPGLADAAIPADSPRMVEARRDVRTKLTLALGSYALEYEGGVSGYLDALADLADEDETFQEDLAAVVASAYRIQVFESASYGETDIWAEKARQERMALKEAVNALARTSRFALEVEVSPNVVPRARGRISTHRA